MIVYGIDLAQPGRDMTCKATFERLPDGTLVCTKLEYEESPPQSDTATEPK